MTKPIASLSLDLDNKWAYLRTHGVVGWEKYPSYFDVVIPRIVRCCADRNLLATCFVVGRDAQRRENLGPLAELVEAGHEIGNHSLNHYPWLHTLSREEVETEVCLAEEYIERATGQLPVGFRGPGYSLSESVLEILAARGYQYDASTLPTYIGPLARWYFRRTATAAAGERADRREMFGTWRDGLQSNKPYVWSTDGGPLVEIPVTTFPVAKLPIHMTYLLYLWQFSPRLARIYLKLALASCRLLRIGPTVLLHPLDFLGVEDDPDLRFFPGMNLPRQAKLALLDDLLAGLTGQFRLVPIREHAAAVRRQFGLAEKTARDIPVAIEPLVAAVGEAG
ncbi:MAG: polysaccharide deacetylase family protein [Pirellulales bacterium]